ncbi:hypothetical protein [Thermosipho atlanticus]|uniref:Uncharacterized protein n=1 Tax=Thermosipho atlanticus DSM 15807 TaxID=1123380 RepID=A0A1M5T4F5_9BACT|nr:hypothetical protein [Thermosipho atlanticus]SHH45625.1 hypothetical protein SAMN02745199_1163 [Thermosipho atlanticus DSM 15807]
MKRLFLILLFLLVLVFVLWSCGLQLPNSVTVSYSNHFEFPLAMLHFTLDDFINPVLLSLENEGFQVTTGDPITISFATTTTFIPGDYLPTGIPISGTETILDQATLIQASTMQNGNVLQNVDFNMSFEVGYFASTTTFDSTLVFYINSTPVVISENSTESENLTKYVKEVLKSGQDLTVRADIDIDGTIQSSDELMLGVNWTFSLEGTTLADIVFDASTTDLSVLESLTDFVDSATIVFDEWDNSLGFDTVFDVGNLSFYFGTTPPIVGLSKDDLISIATDNVPYVIKVPANSYIKLKSNSYLDSAVYISLDLTVATEVTF